MAHIIPFQTTSIQVLSGPYTHYPQNVWYPIIYPSQIMPKLVYIIYIYIYIYFFFACYFKILTSSFQELPLRNSNAVVNLPVYWAQKNKKKWE